MLAQALAHARVVWRRIVQVIGFGGRQLHLRGRRGRGRGWCSRRWSGCRRGWRRRGCRCGRRHCGRSRCCCGRTQHRWRLGASHWWRRCQHRLHCFGRRCEWHRLEGVNGLHEFGRLWGRWGRFCLADGHDWHHHFHHLLQQALVQGPQRRQVEDHHAGDDDGGAGQFQCLCSSAWAEALGVCT
jgi:hypothetical protein